MEEIVGKKHGKKPGDDRWEAKYPKGWLKKELQKKYGDEKKDIDKGSVGESDPFNGAPMHEVGGLYAIPCFVAVKAGEMVEIDQAKNYREKEEA